MTAQLAAHGRLVADVQTKTTGNGTSMAYSRMAVPLPCRASDNGETTLWLGITAFGKQADLLARQQKGDLISVAGAMQVNQWTGQDGTTQSGYSLVAESVISARTVRGGARKPANTGGAKPPPAGSGEFSDDVPF
ncbi:single-stranded DNA-binding protein [Cedecea sp. NFIX57]|uniref:single-stranded DNA-binding protein n=1 Tax=Cedecea sp. NFIX57 TaxID=1566286 RepID=UPI000A0A8E6D|nr:single-stranded DNA-binding protein [Cedecea sp. NFIX57]SMG37423.1 Single-stranded DNA-binding protein [Cedecea sp. NFIX57]